MSNPNNKDSGSPSNKTRGKDFPFGESGNEPMKQFGGVSMNELFNSFSWKAPILEELKKERNTKILGYISLFSFLASLVLSESNEFLVLFLFVLSVTCTIIWAFRRDYIFFYRK